MQTELEIMGEIARLLEPLDDAARTRVINWVLGALRIETAGRRPTGERTTSDEVGPRSPAEFATFAEFFHAASPNSEREKALVAAFWLQKSSGASQFVSQQLNTELKNIGYGIGNITDALSQLISEKPNLVIQVMKSGSTRQARKTYRITDAGMRRIAEMLAVYTGN